MYHYVVDKLGLPANGCLALEDSRNGVRAAHAAGLPVIVTVNDYTKNDDFGTAELIVDQFGEPDSPFSLLGGRWAGRLTEKNAYIDIATLGQLLND